MLRHRILTSLPSEYATIVQEQIRRSDKSIPELFEQLAITDSFNASLNQDHTPTASALAAANQPAKRKRLICTYKPCGKLGHTADKCWLKNPLLKPAKANYTITDSALCTMGNICKIKENCPDRMLREAAKSRLVIMTSHNTEFLPFAQRIIALSKGMVVFSGSYESYLENAIDYEIMVDEKQEQKPPNSKEKGTVLAPNLGTIAEKVLPIQLKKDDIAATSKTSFETFLIYARSCGFHNIFIAMFLTVLAYGISATGDYLLAATTEGFYTFNEYLIGYSVISFMVIAINVGRYFMYAYAGICASKVLQA